MPALARSQRRPAPQPMVVKLPVEASQRHSAEIRRGHGDYRRRNDDFPAPVIPAASASGEKASGTSQERGNTGQ